MDTKTITPDRDKMREAFKDHDTKITDDHLAESCREELEMFYISLWGAWHLAKEPGICEQTLGTMVNQFHNLDSKVQKTLDFAELAQYATGFEIPDHKSFSRIDIESLTKSEG